MTFGAWIAIFGGVGARLAAVRRGSSLFGFLAGALLGPVGWRVVIVRTRGSGVPRGPAFTRSSVSFATSPSPGVDGPPKLPGRAGISLGPRPPSRHSDH